MPGKRRIKQWRVVFDTNVFISAIMFGGKPGRIFGQAREKKIQLVTSRPILLELATKLHEKFGVMEQEVVEVIEGIGLFAEVVKPRREIRVIKADPTDNIFLECALEGKADVIVSGDRQHILSLKKFGEVKIVSPAEFLKRYGGGEDGRYIIS